MAQCCSLRKWSDLCMGSFCCSWYCRAYVLNSGLIYSQVNNFSIPRNKRWKRPTEGLPFCKPCERTCFVQPFLCLLKMTQMEGLHTLLWSVFSSCLVRSWSLPVLLLSIFSKKSSLSVGWESVKTCRYNQVTVVVKHHVCSEMPAWDRQDFCPSRLYKRSMYEGLIKISWSMIFSLFTIIAVVAEDGFWVGHIDEWGNRENEGFKTLPSKCSAPFHILCCTYRTRSPFTVACPLGPLQIIAPCSLAGLCSSVAIPESCLGLFPSGHLSLLNQHLP